jgi:outer membrane protein assembly factor BamD
MHRTSWRLVAALCLLAAACRPEFQLKRFTTNEALYTASLREYQRKKYDNAVAGFEKLTTDLPPRDSLLPRSYWYLANAHEHLDEHLLAAQSFNRLVETFPDDSLADDAALAAGRAYRKLWRKPSLDPTYGETAIATFNTLIGLYPDSKLVDTAQKEIMDLNNWFAIKDFDTGIYYFRRKAYDSANLYFTNILAKWPDAPTARSAAIQLVKSYKAIRYTSDAAELCARLRVAYSDARDVREACADVPAAPADTTKPATPVPPPKPPARR